MDKRRVFDRLRSDRHIVGHDFRAAARQVNANYWTVPPMFAGRTVAVLASGPSMSQAVADQARHLPRIAINTTYRLAPDADIIYAGDAAWWAAHPQALDCPGIKASIEILPKIAPATPDAVRVLRNTGRDGFDPDPSCLRTLANSGAQALQVAVHAGAARVLLLGFDMRGGHWHADHEGNNPSNGQMARWAVRFRGLAWALMARGISVINCTPGSLLDCFPREDLDGVLLRIASLGELRKAA
jgi:hypothetical protein